MTSTAEVPELKQYGLHRSGTNFLRVILQENYEVLVHANEGGWKHGYYELPQRLGRELHCLICFKNPYAWLFSLYNYRHPEKELPFSAFVRQPLTVVPTDVEHGPIQSRNPARLWVEMNQHWLGIPLRDHRLFLFRYEQVLKEPYTSVQELVQTLGLRRRETLGQRMGKMLGVGGETGDFFVPPRQLGALRPDYKKKNLNRGEVFDPGKYTRHEYLAAYTQELLDFVNEQLNHELLERVGYETVRHLPGGTARE